ncbi:MAG: T9SS C-terminal target domain-containing protein [Ignavibacteriae bacterium]|nr:MAG: T9SS C-terminal target domain-containing protein [Ignavibacteriota bacterium]
MPALTQSGLTRDSGIALSKDVANIWQTAIINTDGDALELFSGHPESRINLSSYKPFIMSNGSLLSVFVPHTPMFYTSGSTGIKWNNKRISYPQHVSGVDANTMQYYIQNPPSFGTMQPPYATDPIQLPDGKILISYATQVVNQDYGLYTINLDGTGLQLFYDIPGKLELNTAVLLPKTIPPIRQDFVTNISDELPPTSDPGSYFKNGGFRFDCVNIFTNGEVDEPMTDAPPITKNARMDFFLNFQRKDSLGLDTAIKFQSMPVEYAGGVHMDFAPADVAMFEQVIDSSGRVLIGSKNQIAHVTGMNFGRPGTGTKCVGCHAGHTTIPVPPTISEGQLFNVSTSANVTQSSYKFVNDSVQFPGKRVVDRKARNDSLRVNWIANGTTNEFVELQWDLPVDVRSLKLYNVKPNPQTNTNIQVNDCEIYLFYQNVVVSHISSTGFLSVNGTSFQFSGLPKIDKAKIIIKSFSGLVNGENRAALAEVETDARISYYDVIGIKQISSIADGYYLSQNFPNPFNPATKISYSIPKPGFVKLVVYDITGREVNTPVDQLQMIGTYNVEFNGSGLASGIYFYQLTISNEQSAKMYRETKKMVLIR